MLLAFACLNAFVVYGCIAEMYNKQDVWRKKIGSDIQKSQNGQISKYNVSVTRDMPQDLTTPRLT